MAAGRKLQAEVDKMLKKVEEGIEEFQNIWDNVHSATNSNQREKFEVELKTQIKKLQRDREQIKTWQSDKSIKDKNQLGESRKKIEHEMERFKEFERDAKTKTYSKEGLSKTDKLDPYLEEKLGHRSWIQECIDKMQVQIDELEADVEASKRSKKPDEARVAQWKCVQDSHRWHATKLEQLLRKLDNDEVDFEELTSLQELVEYYADPDQNSHAAEEFNPFDGIYEGFALEEVEDYLSKDRDRRDSDLQVEEKEPEASAEVVAPVQSEPAKEKAPSRRTGGVIAEAAKASASPAARTGRGNREEAAAETTSTQKPWPPMVSVWTNPPAAALPTPPAQATPRPTPTLPPPTQPAPERPPPPGQAPVLNAPPQQPPPKPAPHQPPPPHQPPTQAPPQPPLPSPPVGSPPRPSATQTTSIAPPGSSLAGIVNSTPMPPPPSVAPPAPKEGAAATAASQTPTEPPAAAPPPPPPPPLPPPPPSPAPAPGGPPSLAPAMPPTQGKGQATIIADTESPQWPLAPQPSESSTQPAPKVPPPSEAPPPPAELPPPPPPDGAKASAAPTDPAPAIPTAIGEAIGPGGSFGGDDLDSLAASAIGAGAPRNSEGSYTTLAILNIPPTVDGQEQACQWLDSAGFGGWYDFLLYVPGHRQRQRPHALAVAAAISQPGGSCVIVNFAGATGVEVAQSCQRTLDGKTCGTDDDSVVSVMLTRIQGLDECVDHFGSYAEVATQHAKQSQPSAPQASIAIASSMSLTGPSGSIPSNFEPGLSVGGIGQAVAAAAAADAAASGASAGITAPSDLVGLSPDRLHCLQQLSASHRNLPQTSDRRRNRKYVPRSPYMHLDTRQTAAYPMQPTRNYDDPAMFEKYDLDTLFFIFYYQQGSYQQHLAAKELKKLSWRYHTKYLTWFQRHEEPRMTASDFERGAYVYFDHDAGWCQRIKSDFTFEYQFLEDEPM